MSVCLSACLLPVLSVMLYGKESRASKEDLKINKAKHSTTHTAVRQTFTDGDR